MDSIISPFQSAFIKGRQILDLVLIANEAVEDYRAKEKRGWIMKLDLEKKFNRLDRGYLKQVLHCKKFSSKWSKQMLGCLKSPQFSIFINEKLRDRIVASRAIRQGYPLSPFLSFLLVSEVLGAIINKLHNNGHFKGYTVEKEKLHILIL